MCLFLAGWFLLQSGIFFNMGVNEERVTFCELAVRVSAVDATITALLHF